MSGGCFIVIGYKWNNHTDNVNMSFSSSHIKISDTIYSDDSIIDYLNSKIVTTSEGLVPFRIAYPKSLMNCIPMN